MNNNINSLTLTFRQKLSFVQNINEHKSVLFKIYKICELIFSCGKCDLHITRAKCKYLIHNKRQCLFSRAIIIIMPELVGKTINNNSPSLDNAVSKPQEVNVVINNIKAQSTGVPPSLNDEVDDLLDRLIEVDNTEIKNYEKDIKSLFLRSVETNNHTVLDILTSFSIDQPEILPNELLSFSALEKSLKDAYIIDFMKSKEKYSGNLFQFIFIKGNLLNEKVMFEDAENSFVTPLYLAILYNNMDSLELLLQFHPDINRCDEKNTDILKEFIKYYQQDDFQKHYISLMKEIKNQNATMKHINLEDQLIKAFIFVNPNAIKFLLEQGGEGKGKKPGYLYSYKIDQKVELFEQAFKSDYEYAHSLCHPLLKEEKSLCEFERSRVEVVKLLIEHPNIETRMDCTINNLLMENPNIDPRCVKLIINNAIRCGFCLDNIITIIDRTAEKHSNKMAILSIKDELIKRYGTPYKCKKTPMALYEKLQSLRWSEDENEASPAQKLYDYCSKSYEDDPVELKKHCNAITGNFGKKSRLLLVLRDNCPHRLQYKGFLPIHYLCMRQQYKSALMMLKKYPCTNIKTYETCYNLLYCLASCNPSEEEDTHLSNLVKHLLLICKVSPYETCMYYGTECDAWDLAFEFNNKTFLKVLLEHSIHIPNESNYSAKRYNKIGREMLGMLKKRHEELILQPLE
ncbi:MAG: ankyrin repeat domain-containing protein [Endozoicomonadaceae bacterium]|nr:ankyrin repeat domain-containing protein [Endozoicomonadaceae bacterium]